MAQQHLLLPVIQNWSCHNCGGCCREHLIEITEHEKRQIEKQGWTAADGISMERPVIQKIGRGRFRLAHQHDGACVFLDDKGFCRIHAKFGEAAKPLACRVYPYAFHPAGHGLSVSLRFSCPSVVQNRGNAVDDQRSDLQQLASKVVSGKESHVPPPSIHGDQRVEWPDFHRFLKALDDAIADDSVDFVVRLLRVLSWLELVEESQFQTIRGAKLDEYLNLLISASEQAQPDNDLPIVRPKRIARVIFRLIAAQFSRHDTEALVRGGWKTRLRLGDAAIRFALGLGTVPQLPESASVAKVFAENENEAHSVHETELAAARFSLLEGEFQCRRAEIDALFTRYFRVKIQGIHFCGPAHYDSPLLDGFRCLALMYPVVLWLARVRAVRHGRRSMKLMDVEAALATADHNFGYSPALGTTSALNRINILSRLNQLTRLCAWYSR